MKKQARSLLTTEWYVVPISVDCTGCGAQTRSAGIVVGPSSMTNAAGFELDREVFGQPWERLEAFGLVERLGGRTENVERFIVQRFQGAFQLREDGLAAVCQHCGDGLAGSFFRLAAMDGFIRLGQRRLLNNERLMVFASDVELTQFHGGTWIEESGIDEGGYSLLLLGDAEDDRGSTGVIELWYSVARNDYAFVVKGLDGRETLRREFGSDLELIVADLTGLGLVLTQLHLAQVDSPYCDLARSLFLEALKRAGYEQDE